jgi:hypothetical protein
MIRERLEYFKAIDIDNGDVINSIEFRLPDTFNPDRTTWKTFLIECSCNLEQSSLPT